MPRLRSVLPGREFGLSRVKKVRFVGAMIGISISLKGC